MLDLGEHGITEPEWNTLVMIAPELARSLADAGEHLREQRWKALERLLALLPPGEGSLDERFASLQPPGGSPVNPFTRTSSSGSWQVPGAAHWLALHRSRRDGIVTASGMRGFAPPTFVHRGTDRDAHTRAQTKANGDGRAADQNADRHPDTRTDRDANTDVLVLVNLCRVAGVLGHFHPLTVVISCTTTAMRPPRSGSGPERLRFKSLRRA